MRGDFWRHNRPSTARRAVVVGGVVLAIALWSTVAVFTVSQLADDTEPDEAVSAPSEWNPEIEPYAREVERIQGGEFRDPVPVRFISDNDFERLLAGAGSSSDGVLP